MLRQSIKNSSRSCITCSRISAMLQKFINQLLQLQVKGLCKRTLKRFKRLNVFKRQNMATKQIKRPKYQNSFKTHIGGHFPVQSGCYYIASSNKDLKLANVCLSRKDFRDAVVAARGAFWRLERRAASTGARSYRIRNARRQESPVHR